MPLSMRASGALGAGLVAVAFLAGQLQGQNPTAAKIGPAVIATIDLEKVMQNYEKTKFVDEQIKAEILARQGKLQKLNAEGKAILKEMENFQQGSADFKSRESKLTTIKAQLEAEREQAQRDIQQKQADAMATFYKEVQVMVKWLANKRGYSHVMKVMNEPVAGPDPQTVYMLMSRSVVYSNTECDITDEITQILNKAYENSKGNGAPAAKRGAPNDPATRPASTAPAGGGGGGARQR